MAQRCIRTRIAKHLFLSEGFLEAVLICIAICMNFPSTSHAQTGFLSIDCGYTGTNYTDSNNLTWVPDETFINIGVTAEESYVYSSFPESGQYLRTFRSFPNLDRSKYCYNLPTTANVRYLIRANFYLNGSMFSQNRPFQFNLFINANNWFTITSGDDSPNEFYITEEAIFFSQENTTYICLQPMLGVPFISSLELRPIESNIYSYPGSHNQYLFLQQRANLGANSTPSVRFPDDIFDRIWYTPSPTWAGAFPIISTPTPPDNTSGLREEVNFVPPVVMQDGWVVDGRPIAVTVSFADYAYTEDQGYSTPGEYAFVVLYTEYLNISDSTTYKLDTYLDNELVGSTNFSHKASVQSTPNFILSSNNLIVEMNVLNASNDTGTLNAIEVYDQVNYNFSQTFPQDVTAIEALKRSISMENWQGDPCTPVPYDWLSCDEISTWENIYKDVQPIQQPCGWNVTSVKECQVPQGSYYLNTTYSVNALNLSNLEPDGLNFFTKRSSNAFWLFNLAEMRIRSSGIDTETFTLLANNFFVFLAKPFILDLSNNSIDSIPVASNWITTIPWNESISGSPTGQMEFAFKSLQSLNLSHNVLKGTLSSFENIPFANSSLQELDLSYNLMSSLPTAWINTTNALVFLDLSHNQLQADISALDPLIKINNGTLQTLNVSYNKFSGVFTSSLYFSNLPNLTAANFDNNSITGTLDLSQWYKVLQIVATGNSSTSVDTLPLFSFVNNSIKDIYPSAETFQSIIIDTLIYKESFNETGIFLGGNPYCNNAKSLIQRYFCRFSPDDTISYSHSSNKTGLIVGICIGVGVFTIFLFVTLATLWRLWRQVRELREIQQVLSDRMANRKVQPPFYEYAELKLATNDFHHDCKLGHGGYGVVYKGVLPDKTKLAVKKLFNQRLRDLDEFFNEVVLITGIKHKNLIQLKGCCIKDKQQMLIYEYADKGNLAEALWGSKIYRTLSWDHRFNICLGVARGLCYLHEELQPSIIHRDIKPENVLLDINLNPKIADFGLARESSPEANQDHYTKVAGTLGYFSPEYASEGRVSNKSDVYSYGVLLLEVVSGRKSIDASLPHQEKFLTVWARKLHKLGLILDMLEEELRGTCDEAVVTRVISIGLLCVSQDPDRRPPMSSVVHMLLACAESDDIEVPLDGADDVHPDFQRLMFEVNDDLRYTPLHSIEEEYSPNYSPRNPLMLIRSNSAFGHSPNSAKNSRPLIELSNIQGR